MEDGALKRVNIAIDGPAGAGKSSIAKRIAKQLGILYLDTGAMYRTVALKAMREGMDTQDGEKLAELVKTLDIKIRYTGNEQLIFLDGEDVSKSIRTSGVSLGATHVAAIPAVRIRLVEIQREIARENSVVMDGRDIGTCVLPQADLKVFLTASVEERAKRRHNEQLAKGMEDVSLEEVKKDIEYRDRKDSGRTFAPLRKASDAVEIDTTGMTIEEVVQKIITLVKSKD